ncbi:MULTISPECIES: hypothetical protein [unclassified Sphingobium]|uniref:hypothetical protein n=1 Tax=unclassified Sphingobium TaxID=2611147 RepID=UPI0022242E30|nr:MULTISPECIES: hypothetical protein [unclassified Sphingobium]MCW2411804.1 hypothetical protein [Sphingobium sp. B8D3D]MCW2415898.1 hypothetical protein [Sphingobium sp. B8D3A]
MEPENRLKHTADSDGQLIAIAVRIAERWKQAAEQKTTPVAIRKRVIALAIEKSGDLELNVSAMASIVQEQFKLLSADLGLRDFSEDTIKRDIVRVRSDGRGSSKVPKPKMSQKKRQQSVRAGHAEKTPVSRDAPGDDHRIASQANMFGAD